MFWACFIVSMSSCDLQEGEAFEVIPGTNFTVARTAHRNNTSDYYINDRKVRERLCDVHRGLVVGSLLRQGPNRGFDQLQG